MCFLPTPVGSYLIAKDLISVSGISSGGAFGVQFHVAFSGDIMGAGILAGGTCTQNN